MHRLVAARHLALVAIFALLAVACGGLDPDEGTGEREAQQWLVEKRPKAVQWTGSSKPVKYLTYFHNYALAWSAIDGSTNCQLRVTEAGGYDTGWQLVNCTEWLEIRGRVPPGDYTVSFKATYRGVTGQKTIRAPVP